MLQPCVYCSSPKSLRIRSRNNVLISSLHPIERYALDGNGAVGSFYDPLMDSLLSPLYVSKDQIILNDVKETAACNLIKVHDTTSANLLQMINIQDDLRLSITLNMIPIIKGTLMLHTYKLPVDREVRLIHYHYVNQEESLSVDIELINKTLLHSLPNYNATHIITSVKRGFDFVIVLELPENVNHSEIDPVLEKLCKYFRQSKAEFLLAEDQKKIDCLKQTVYTQIPKTDSTKGNENLSDICRYMHQYIYNSKNNFTLSYTLHPVTCVYFDIPCKERIFLKIDPAVMQKIEQKIIPLWNKLKTIKRLFDDKQLLCSSQFFQTCANDIYKKLFDVELMHSRVQRNVAKVIIEFRQGKPNLSLVDNQLNSREIKSFELVLDSLQTIILDYQSKPHFVPKLKTDCQMENIDMAVLQDADDDQEMLENTRTIVQSPAPSTTEAKEINVLLIGETGVGKSTFINAFVNYLAFHSMQQATNGEPIVLIPVSFLITIGDNFEEKPIKFGQFDANEDHNHSGQSVTQHCKSYTFTIKNNIKLRIIDTPGVGDTRGAEQDNQNIDDILSYTSNLSHLNAICFLLKPNTTRLNILFRSCFMQLFNFLGPNACKNIIFCFTNTRATFYAPGDTAKLLKTMLNDLPNNHRPSFTKENTFCFDSESFRYLTVIKNGYTLAFDEKQKLDFEKSWQMSVTESIRLLKFVESRSQYVMNEWHSMKHAQMMIKLLARPILETICNALRNLILWKLNHKRRIIEFKPQSISLPTWLCTDCSYEIKQIDNISIVTHPVRNNRTSNRYGTCRCTSYEHLPIFYELQYQLGSTKGIKFSEETEKIKDRLLDGSVILSQFLFYTTDTPQDPFVFWFDLLIKEQEYLSSKEPLSTPKIKLYDEKKKYLDKLKDIKRDDERIKLDAVYKCIEEILAYPQIIIQINATKESQMKMMKNNECDVSSQYPHMNKFL